MHVLDRVLPRLGELLRLGLPLWGLDLHQLLLEKAHWGLDLHQLLWEKALWRLDLRPSHPHRRRRW